MSKKERANTNLRVCESCGSTDDVRWWEPTISHAGADDVEAWEGQYLCQSCRDEAEAELTE